MSFVIRAAKAEDAEALGAIHVDAWLAAYRGLMPDEYLDSLTAEQRAENWRTILERPPRAGVVRLVAQSEEPRDGGVVGFVLAGPSESGEDVGEIFALNVDPRVWGSGAGSALLAAGTSALTGLRRAILWVHPGNDRARNFYEDHGWRCDEVNREEIVMGVDVAEIRYSKDLAGS
jgi:RimJ/RimL family protein N-acetyltransferase